MMLLWGWWQFLWWWRCWALCGWQLTELRWFHTWPLTNFHRMWTWFRNDELDVDDDLGNLFVISTFSIISLLHRSHLQLINLAKIPETGDWRYWGMEIMGRHYHQHYHQHLNHYHHHHHHQKHLRYHCHHHFSTVLIFIIIFKFTASCLANYNTMKIAECSPKF